MPITPDDPAVPANRAAWAVLERWEKPALTLWAPNDPVLGGLQQEFLDRIPGTAGLPHQTFTAASHFLQEDVGPELAQTTVLGGSPPPDRRGLASPPTSSGRAGRGTTKGTDTVGVRRR